MLPPIGEMREPVVVLTPTTVIDESGGETTTYVASDTHFAAVRPLTARETAQFNQINGSVTHALFGHYEVFKAVTSDSRIRLVEDNTEFDIVGPPLNSPKRDHTKLMLELRENV